MKTSQGILLCLLTFLITLGEILCQNQVRWIQKPASDLLSEGIEPAGYERDPYGEGIHTYLCRAINGTDRIVGKIMLEYSNYTDRILCAVLDDAGQIVFLWNGFEVLDSPAESLSWIPYSRPALTSAIKSEANGKTVYVCRGSEMNIENEIVPGSMEENTAVCRLVKEGVITTGNFQILVINASGKRRGVEQQV